MKRHGVFFITAVMSCLIASGSPSAKADPIDQTCSLSSESFDVVMRDPDFRLWLTETDGVLSLNVAAKNPGREQAIRRMILDVLVQKSLAARTWKEGVYGTVDLSQ